LLERSSISFREAQSYYKTSTPWKSLTPLTGHADGGEQGHASAVCACHAECYAPFRGDIPFLVPGKGWPLLPLHLRQHCLRLRQPEGHVHSTIHLDSGRERGARLPPLAGHSIPRAEALVAVGLERAHTACLGQGEGLLVKRFGLRRLWRVTLGGNIAAEPQGPRLEATFSTLVGQAEGTLSLRSGFGEAAPEERALAQFDEPDRLVASGHGGFLCHRLLQQGVCVGHTPREGIHQAQGRCTLREPVQAVPPTTEIETTFEEGHGTRALASEEG